MALVRSLSKFTTDLKIQQKEVMAAPSARIVMMNRSSTLTTVVSYPERGQGGNNRYRGNCSPRLIEDLIAHFGVQDICDYMCGSNTTGDAARTMGISSHTYDLHSGFDLLHCDIPERPEYIFGIHPIGILSGIRT